MKTNKGLNFSLKLCHVFKISSRPKEKTFSRFPVGQVIHSGEPGKSRHDKQKGDAQFPLCLQARGNSNTFSLCEFTSIPGRGSDRQMPNYYLQGPVHARF